MWIRVILGALVSAVGLMAWGFAFWMGLAAPLGVMKALPAEATVVVGKLRDQVPDSGAYFYPHAGEEDAATTPQESEARYERFMKAHRQGPLIQMFYRREGIEPMAPAVFAQGFAHFFISSLVAGSLLCWLAPRLPRFGQRFGLVVAMVLLAVVLMDLSYPVWFHHPWRYWLMLGVFHLGEGLVMGLALGAIVRPTVRVM
jgi:hypothetical protein